MYIYDSHVHCGEHWFEPISTLLHEMDTNGVSRALLIPYAGYFDNSYMFQCMKDHPDRIAVSVQVDSESPDAAGEIRRLRDQGAVGIRLRPYEPCPGDDPFALWRVADEVGLSVSCHGNLKMFADLEFHKAVESLPNLTIVLEHFGGASRTVKFPEPQLELLDGLLALAKYPNVYIKFPGFGELWPRPFPFTVPAFKEPPAYVKQVFDAFGAKRTMWGSDFPPSAGREGYANVLKLPMNNVPYFMDEDKDWIFGKTALSVWG